MIARAYYIIQYYEKDGATNPMVPIKEIVGGPFFTKDEADKHLRLYREVFGGSWLNPYGVDICGPLPVKEILNDH